MDVKLLVWEMRQTVEQTGLQQEDIYVESIYLN